MIKQTQTFLRQLVRLVDGAAIALAFLATYYLRQNVHFFYHLDMIEGNREMLASLKDLDGYLWLLLIILPIWLGHFHLFGAYKEMRTKSRVLIAWSLLKANIISLMAFAAVIFLLKLDYVSRTFLGLFFVLSYAFVCIERGFLIYVWHRIALKDHFQKKILMVGTGRRAQALIRSIYAHRNWGIKLVGLVDRDSDLIGKKIEGTQVIGVLEELPLILREQVIDEVMFVVPRNWMGIIEEGVLQCEKVGVRATLAADLFDIQIAKAQTSDIEGIPLISFDPTPMDQWKLAIKRCMDIALAIVALVILSPVFLVTAIAVKLTSPGPVFFRQTRCGLNGRLFTLFKFRSMCIDAEAKLASLRHLNEVGGPVFKMENDPRLTAIGKFLRKTSVDELPQLVNVLKGEISLVGPRPPVPNEVAQYQPWQRRRLSMRPGITGYWQVNGRSEVKDFDKWMKLDLEYIDKWSLTFDMKIILKTIPTVLFGVGAK